MTQVPPPGVLQGAQQGLQHAPPACLKLGGDKRACWTPAALLPPALNTSQAKTPTVGSDFQALGGGWLPFMGFDAPDELIHDVTSYQIEAVRPSTEYFPVSLDRLVL